MKYRLSRTHWITLSLLIVLFAAVGVRYGCYGDSEGTSAETTAEEPAIGEAQEDRTPPPDPYAGVNLPITASRVPLPEQDLLVVSMTPSAVLVAGEVVAALSAGSMETAEATETFAEEIGVHLMGNVSEENARVLIAPDRVVHHRVVSIMLQTVHDIGARPLLVAMDITGEKRLVPFHIPTPEELAADASFRLRTERPRNLAPNAHEPQRAVRHPLLTVESGFGLPTLGLGIGRSPMAGNVVQITAHPTGLWLLGGTLGEPLGRLRGLGPRSIRHPNVVAIAPWSADTAVAEWIDWAGLQAQLLQVRSTAELRAMVLQPRVGLDSNLPYELLVRLIDLVQFGVSLEALQSDSEFENLFLSGESRTELLTPPAVMLTL